MSHIVASEVKMDGKWQFKFGETMRARYAPADGGRFGFCFNYWCAECGAYLGNSTEHKVLEHETVVVTRRLFRKSIKRRSDCVNAGKKMFMPIHVIELREMGKL